MTPERLAALTPEQVRALKDRRNRRDRDRKDRRAVLAKLIADKPETVPEIANARAEIIDIGKLLVRCLDARRESLSWVIPELEPRAVRVYQDAPDGCFERELAGLLVQAIEVMTRKRIRQEYDMLGRARVEAARAP